MSITVKFIQGYYRTLSPIVPKYAFKKAVNLFETVRKKDIRPREQSFYQKAKHYTIPGPKGPIYVYELGDVISKPIFVLHGWDSNAGSMSLISEKLSQSGFRVIAMNLPAHAFSTEKRTNFHESKSAFIELLNYFDFNVPISVVAHSFGSGIVSASFAELDYELDKLVFLTTPNKMIDIFTEYKNMIKLGDKPFEMMCDWASSIVQEDLREMTIAQKVGLLKFNHLLLIHDKNDKILPHSNSEAIHEAIPNSTLESYESIGHYRMLWNDDIVKSIIDFL